MIIVGSCIILGKFFESLSFYGIKTILFLFLFSKMDYTKDESTFLFHIFLTLVGTFPLFGIFIVKRSPGKLVIAAVLSFLYTIGCILLVLGLVPPIEVPFMQIQVPAWITIFTGLVLIAICSGGIRIYLFAAGFQQFQLPEQVKKLRCFFMGISISIFVGAALSTAIAPILRDDFHCCEDYGCFPLAFAPLAISMILATLMFVAGATKRVVVPRNEANPQQQSNKKVVCTILFLYLHLSVFWALFEQQGSRWTLQATRMDGELWGYNIKPDQMQLSYYLLSLILVPLIYFIIHPILNLIGIRTPLIKIFFGGLLAAAAFFLAACLEVDLENLDPVLPNSETAQLRVYNGMYCDYSLSQILRRNSTETIKVEPLGYYEAKDLQKCNVSFQALDDIYAKSNEFSCSKENIIKAIELGKAVSFFIHQDFIQSYEAHVEKPKLGTPIVRPLINAPQTVGNLTLKDSANLTNLLGPNSTRAIIVTRGNVSLLLNEKPLTTFVARSGCVYVLLGHRNEKQLNEYEFRTYNTVEPNTVHMMWQLPQYICITAGEILVTKNAFEFTFSKAPAAMQAALQSTWSLTMALGNLLAIIIMKYKFCDAQSEEYRLFAYIMLIDMIIFLLWAMCCKCLKSVKKEPENVKPENVKPENVKPVNVEPEKAPESQVQFKSKKGIPESQDQQKTDLPNSKAPLSGIPESQDQQKPITFNAETPISGIPEIQEQRKSSLPRTSKTKDRRKSSMPRDNTNLPSFPESQDRRKSNSSRKKSNLPQMPESQDRRKSSLPRENTNLPRMPESQERRKSITPRYKTNVPQETKPNPPKKYYTRAYRNSRSPRRTFVSSSSTSSSRERTKSLSYPKLRLRPRKSSSPAVQQSKKREKSKSPYNPPSSSTSYPRSSTTRSSTSSAAISGSRPKEASAPKTHRSRRSRIPSPETFKPLPNRSPNPRSSNRRSSKRRSSKRRSSNPEPPNHHDRHNYSIGPSNILPHLIVHSQKVIESDLVYVPYIPSKKRNRSFNSRSSSR